jgi:hypothetical protein
MTTSPYSARQMGTGISTSAVMACIGGIHWGTAGDVPVPGDYDADNIYDVAVYRDGIWYINGSTENIAPYPFGLALDIPIPKKYIP